MVTLYSAWLKVGASSLTSLIVMVISASDRVVSSRPELEVSVSHFSIFIFFVLFIRECLCVRTFLAQ